MVSNAVPGEDFTRVHDVFGVKGFFKPGVLDDKTGEIACIAILAAVGLESGIPYHVKHARELGTSREEIISAVLLGMPAVGNRVVQVLPIALQAFDE